MAVHIQRRALSMLNLMLRLWMLLLLSGWVLAQSPTTPNLEQIKIETLKQRSYPGSEVRLEQTLAAGSNYRRYIASYRSDGLKIYALLTVPTTRKPAAGWPVVVFNHGYIPPKEYRTTVRYEAYVDAFARAGYVVFKPDYRGHGNSQGEATGAYWHPGYTADVLNAVGSIKRYKDANPQRVGLWGHSMGGYLTLRAMVLDKSIRAGVIWAGVVAPQSDLLEKWRRPSNLPSQYSQRRQRIYAQYGNAAQNPALWNAISANSYLARGMAPLQIHHGTADTVVPLAFSQTLSSQLKAAKQVHEFYTYAGADHNIRQSFSTAMRRSVAFFDRYLKN